MYSKESRSPSGKKSKKSSARIRDFISRFNDGTVRVNDNVSYDIRKVIQNNYRLFNSKFEDPVDGDLDKIFFNMSWIMYRTVFYSSDIDQKDLQMRATNPNAIAAVALLRMAVENYLSRIHFGKTMDDMRAYMIAHGTVVVKVADGSPRMVDLRNMVRPAHIEDIQESGVAERVFYTYEEIMAIDMDANAKGYVEAMWKRMQKENIYLFPVYEFWHEFKIKGRGDKKKEYHKGCQRWLDSEILVQEAQQTNNTAWEPYCFLDEFQTPYKKRRTSRALIKKYGEYEEIYPYKQANFIDVPGRWLGFGVFELLQGVQEYFNEKWHLYRKKDLLDLRGIYTHTKGPTGATIEQRFLDALETGAFIDLEQDEEVNRLITDMKTGEFVASIDKLMEFGRQIIGVTAQGIGQDMPSTTTATVGVLNQKAQQTTYDYVIERMSHFLTELFEDFYIGTILEEISEEEMFQIVGDPSELQELDLRLTRNMSYKLAHDFKRETGFYPPEEMVDQWQVGMMEEQERQGDMRFAELKKELIESIPFTLQFYVNNERFDKGVMIQNLTQLMNNPNFSGSREKLDQAIIDLVGLSGRQFRKSTQEKEAEMEMMAQQEMIRNAANSQPIGVPQPISDAQAFGNTSSPVSQSA